MKHCCPILIIVGSHTYTILLNIFVLENFHNKEKTYLKVSQSWHYLHFKLDKFFVVGLVLCIVGGLATSLVSTY